MAQAIDLTSLRELVREHPWATIGAAAGAGLALGMQSKRLLAPGPRAALVATALGFARRFATETLAQAIGPSRRFERT